MQPTDHSCTKTVFERPKRLKSESSTFGLCGECCDTSHPYQSNYSLVIWTVWGVALSQRMCRTSFFLQKASFSPSKCCSSINCLFCCKTDLLATLNAHFFAKSCYALASSWDKLLNIDKLQRSVYVHAYVC